MPDREEVLEIVVPDKSAFNGIDRLVILLERRIIRGLNAGPLLMGPNESEVESDAGAVSGGARVSCG